MNASSSFRNSTDSKVHLATILIAREHRRTEIDDCGEWDCLCMSCDQVRGAIFRTLPFDQHERLLATGGGRA